MFSLSIGEKIGKKILTVLVFSVISLSFCGWGAAAAREGEGKRQMKTVVVYDAEYRFPIPALASFHEYLGHFELDVRGLHVREWGPGALAGAEIIFFLGLQEEELPHGFAEEIASAARSARVVWIERNAGQLAAAMGWRDFSWRGMESGWTSVQNRYGRRPMQGWMQVGVARPGAGAEIFTRVRNIDAEEALSWRRGNVYYLGCLDFFSPPVRSALADILYRAIPREYVRTPVEPRRMLLRVEDVSPLTNPEALRGILEEIAAYGVPFSIGVISQGAAGDGTVVPLSARPELVEILVDAQERGAGIIMHGYAHGNEFSPLTGEGFEFWNAKADSPMADDERFTRERIELAFAELARCGLYPLAFEPPHYAMSKKGYEVLSEYFNVFSGMLQTADETYKISLTLPFASKSPRLNGMTFLPENMGYYDGDEFRAENLLEKAAEILEADAPFASFFYHGYLPDPEPLRRVIEGSLRMGYTFLDLRTLDVRAGSRQIAISTEDGRVKAVILDPALKASMSANAASGKIRADEKDALNMERLVWVQVCLIAIPLAGIFCLILHLRKTAWKKYEVS